MKLTSKVLIRLFLVFSFAVDGEFMNSQDRLTQESSFTFWDLLRNVKEEDVKEIEAPPLPTPPFNCDPIPPSKTTPSSVHKLRPGDIKVVGALGDSITAGCGIFAKNIPGVAMMYRGWSWSIGGEKDLTSVLTLPNILKLYNPEIKGFSLGKQLFTGRSVPPNEDAHNNVAVPGVTASDLPNQAKRLIRLLKDSPDVDFEKDWKLVTIFIGGNDICLYFGPKGFRFSAFNFRQHMEATMKILSSIPRLVVNVCDIFDSTQVKFLNVGKACSSAHRFLCPLAHHPEYDEEAKALRRDYNSIIRSLAATPRFSRPDSAFIVQSLFRDTKIPRFANGSVDLSYFAPDCYHFSMKGHAAAAAGLWNNLFKPMGKKTTFLEMESFVCPTEKNPFIITA